MNRNIVTTRNYRMRGVAGEQDPIDDYRSKVLKLIPAEIVAAYLTLKEFLAVGQANTLRDWVSWLVFLILLILTPVYYNKVTKVKSFKQLLITSLAFIVWVFSIGGPIGDWLIKNGYLSVADKSLVAGVALILFTLIAPLIYESQPTSQPVGGR